MTTPQAANCRPNRAMSASGPQITAISTPLGPDRTYYRLTFRQVGWIGQTGAFYALDENPRPTEPGSYSPLYFIAHSDDVPDASIDLDEATRLLHRLVDFQDDPCDIDHHGYCQAHNLHEAPCAVAEARAFLARNIASDYAALMDAILKDGAK